MGDMMQTVEQDIIWSERVTADSSTHIIRHMRKHIRTVQYHLTDKQYGTRWSYARWSKRYAQDYLRFRSRHLCTHF